MNVFGDLHTLREQPIPAATLGARRAPEIDTDGAANAEPLVAAAAFGIGGENFYAMARNPPYYEAVPGATELLLVRRGVAARLQHVNARLGAADLELHLFDAWRSQAVQRFFHDHWVPRELRKRRPDLSEQELRAEVAQYWAAPTQNPRAPSPHSTGGAVDLTIRWRAGDPLWMGSLFDDASAISHTAHFEAAAPAAAFSFSNEEARANRRLLYWVMREAGFASNPTEWWHYSYGDQMWASITNVPAALYAGIDEP